MAEQYDFKAPQYFDCWKDCRGEDDNSMEQFFKENEDPTSTSSVMNHNTPKNTTRPYSTSVVSRSGRRCHSFRDSLYLRERESFKKRIMYSQESNTEFHFKARPANVLKKEPFWPYRHSRDLKIPKMPALKTEKRAEHRKLLKEKQKKYEESLELERIQIMKEDEEELRMYRKTLEFKATTLKK